MKMYKEENLSNFEFWSGAVDFANNLTTSELDTVEQHLEELYPDGMDETEINDLFWHDSEWICELLGIDFEEVLNRE